MKISSSRVAVAHGRTPAGGDGEVSQPAQLRTGRAGEVATGGVHGAAVLHARVDVVERDDRRRARRGRRQLAGRRLGGERMRRVLRDPVRADPGDARARQQRELRRGAARAGEHVERFAGRREQRVGLAVGAVDDQVARADLVHGVALPAQARTGEDEEQLLLVDVHVLGHRARARRDPVAAERRAGGAAGAAQPLALAAQLTVLVGLPQQVVPVADHPARMLRARRSIS